MTNEELKNRAETILSDYMNYQPAYYERVSSYINKENVSFDLTRQEDAINSALSMSDFIVQHSETITSALSLEYKAKLKDGHLMERDIDNLLDFTSRVIDFVSNEEVFHLLSDSMRVRAETARKADDLELFDKAS